jgi:hypothetical protein
MKAMGKSVHFGLFPVSLATLVVAMAAGTPANAQATASAAATSGQVTFTKDVAPILQEKCQTCHRSSGIAPMSLLTYEQTRAYAKVIKQRVTSRTMPPWFIDKTVGIQHFANDISLSDAQIATIAKWVDEGTPRGDMKDMPPAKTFDDSDGWRLAQVYGRQPDLVIEGPSYTVKANFQDQWDRPVTNVEGMTGPRWVRAVEMRPVGTDTRKVFHHILANLYQDETGAPSPDVAAPKEVAARGGDGGLLMEWAIGKNYDIYRDGTAKLLMPGAKIRWEYHTHSTTKDITGHAELGVYFYPEGYTPHYRTYLTELTASGRDLGGLQSLDIPPNSTTVSEQFHVLAAPARLENFQAHMHLRGQAMEMEAILPDGRDEVLSYLPNFNFMWMTNYIYADDAAPVLPKGTIVKITAWHNNTSAWPSNPDPNQWVGYGDRTVDEMAHAWVNITYMSQADYDAWAAQHKKPAAQE